VLLCIRKQTGVIKSTNMASAAQAVEVPRPRAEFFNSTSKRTAVLSLLLVMITLVAYNPVVHNDFVNFDDPAYIRANTVIRSGLNWSTIEWAFRSTEQGNWNPITWMSHALDYQVFHANPIGHHYMGVLLHAIAAVLLFLFVQSATGFAWRSMIVAALFTIHPLNVESVAWASERKSVLCMLFFVLALMAYRRYAQHPDWKRYSLVVFLFAMGLMSKPMVVTLPFVLLLIDYWPLERTKAVGLKRLLLEKLPLGFMSVASSIITVIAQRAEGAIHTSDFTLSNRLRNAVFSYACYLGKALWPSNLASFYPHPAHIAVGKVALATVIVGVITFAALRYREQKYLTVGWLWFLGMMVPVIGIVQAGEQGMADRYAYMPFIGLFIAAVWGSAELARKLRIPMTYLGATMGIVIVAFATVTHGQIGYWKNTKTLWTHTLTITQHNYVAEASLGAELISEGNIEEAAKHLRAGMAINPRDPFSHLDLGVCEKRMGHLDEAIQQYQEALGLTTGTMLRSAAYGNLGSSYAAKGNYPLAIQNYKLALQARPDDFASLIGLGVISQKTGKAAAAVEYFSHAAKVQPSDVSVLLVSQALARVGRQQEAQAEFAQAQRMSHDWAGTMAAVGRLLQK